MPIHWKEIFQERNTIAKTEAKSHVEANADQKTLVAIAIRELQDQHAELEKACAVVIGQYKMAGESVERDITLERQLDSQGKAAAKAGHIDAAKAIAHRLDTVRAQLVTEQKLLETCTAAASEAKAAFQQNTEDLQAKMDEAKQLDAEIDQAAVEHNLNEARREVSAASARTTPSFDELRDRVHQQHGQEQADLELQGADTNTVSEGHLIRDAAADDILSQWTSDAPVDDSPAPKATKPPSGGSPTDRLNA